MDAKELAIRLNFDDWRLFTSAEKLLRIKENGLVVVSVWYDVEHEPDGTPVADTYAGFWGAISNDADCFEDNTSIEIGESGVFIVAKKHETQPHWTFEVPFPHETFNVKDHNDICCRGIVFALSDIDKTKSKDQLILGVVKKYSDKHGLPGRGGGEYVHQSDSAQEDAIELFSDIADILEEDSEEE